jgi:hypothetical protein
LTIEDMQEPQSPQLWLAVILLAIEDLDQLHSGIGALRKVGREAHVWLMTDKYESDLLDVCALAGMHVENVRRAARDWMARPKGRLPQHQTASTCVLRHLERGEGAEVERQLSLTA